MNTHNWKTQPRLYHRQYVRNKFKELKKKFGNICMHEGCDKTTKLQFAHKKTTSLNGRGRGSYQRYLDIKNNPMAYHLLCENHHRKFDSHNP